MWGVGFGVWGLGLGFGFRLKLMATGKTMCKFKGLFASLRDYVQVQGSGGVGVVHVCL